MFFQRKPRCDRETHWEAATAVRTSTDSTRSDLLFGIQSRPLPPCSSHQTTSSSATYKYKEVHILMLLWEEDDLECLNEALELQFIFSILYNFTTHISTIPSRGASQHVKNEISKLQHVLNRTDCLLIVYYSGHGNFAKYGRMIWSAYESVLLPTYTPTTRIKRLTRGKET
jgi:hypothetical protein